MGRWRGQIVWVCSSGTVWWPFMDESWRELCKNPFSIFTTVWVKFFSMISFSVYDVLYEREYLGILWQKQDPFSVFPYALCIYDIFIIYVCDMISILIWDIDIKYRPYTRSRSLHYVLSCVSVIFNLMEYGILIYLHLAFWELLGISSHKIHVHVIFIPTPNSP